jgi:hypothetical protein
MSGNATPILNITNSFMDDHQTKTCATSSQDEHVSHWLFQSTSYRATRTYLLASTPCAFSKDARDCVPSLESRKPYRKVPVNRALPAKRNDGPGGSAAVGKEPRAQRCAPRWCDHSPLSRRYKAGPASHLNTVDSDYSEPSAIVQQRTFSRHACVQCLLPPAPLRRVQGVVRALSSTCVVRGNAPLKH